MAVVAYAGLPGDGKSYSAVEHVILPALRAHRCVVTNLAMNREAVLEEIPDADLRSFDADDLLADPEKIEALLPPGCVWVVDEAWRLFPAGITAKNAPAPLKAMLNEHRHRTDEFQNSMQVVLLALDLAGIAAYARQLVAETFKMRKLSALGFSKRYCVDVYSGAVTGGNPPKSRRIRQILGRYRPEVYRFYRSHTKSQTGASGANEAKVDGRASIFRSGFFYLVMPVMAIGLVGGVWYVWRYFHPPAVVAASVRGQGRGAGGPAARRAAAKVPVVSWRIVATLEGGGIDRVLLSDGARSVSLPIRRYCLKDVDGYFICRFEDQEVSNLIHFVPVAAAPNLVGKLLGSGEGQ